MPWTGEASLSVAADLGDILDVNGAPRVAYDRVFAVEPADDGLVDAGDAGLDDDRAPLLDDLHARLLAHLRHD